MDFYITGLPRSKTAWFSAYFTYDNFRCHHEMVANRGFLSILTHKKDPLVIEGNSDSALLNHWQNVTISEPESKWLIVKREFEECKRSCLAFGLSEHHILYAKHQLDLLIQNQFPNLLVIPFNFNLLQLEKACEFIGMKYDHERSLEMMALNIQMDAREVERLKNKHNL